MKQIVCWILCCLNSFFAHSQNSQLCLTTDKTTSLIFPFAIRHVDRGTKNVLVQQVPEATNILLLKAGAVNFPETNLSVVTEDGSLYSFDVSFDPKPLRLVFQLPVQLSASIASYAAGLLDNPPTVRRIWNRKGAMEARVSGIYIKGDVIFYQITIENKSPIDYDLDFLRFYIRDKKKATRTAIQEIEIHPLTIAGNKRQVKSHSTTTLVFALQKFTLPDAKYLAIEVGEKNGGRHLFLKLANKYILRAIPLPDQK